MKKIFSLLIILSVIASFVFFYQPTEHKLELTVLDIGQGDSILIQLPNDQTIMVDGGPDNTVAWELAKALPWWQRKIDYLILTHADSDHYAGLNAVFEKYKVGEFWYNGAQNKAPDFQYLMKQISDQSVPVRIVNLGDSFQLPDSIELKILWPPKDQKLERNAGSVVAKLSYGQIDMLLTGDLPGQQEKELLKRGIDVSAEILKLAHHGSGSSSGADFLQQVDPDVCLISAGLDNRFGHPNPETIIRAEEQGCQILATLGSGAINIAISSSSLSILPK